MLPPIILPLLRRLWNVKSRLEALGMGLLRHHFWVLLPLIALRISDNLMCLRPARLEFARMHLTGHHATVHCVVDMNLDVCMLVVVMIFYLLMTLSSGSSVNCVLPAFIKVGIFTTDIVVQNWSLLDSLKYFARLASMNIIISTGATHLNHVHHILRIWILLLLEI